MCKVDILYDDSEFLISQCSNCKSISLYFQQVIIKFKEEEFRNWYQVFFTSRFEKNAFIFPDDKIKNIIDTPYQELQLCLDKTQFKRLKEGIEQALHFKKIRDIMK